MPTYLVTPECPRRPCQECGADLAMVYNPKTGRTVPVRVATGESHFLDCTNPQRFSKRPAPAKPRLLTGTQLEMFP